MTGNPLPEKDRPPASVRAMNQWVRDAVGYTGRAERRVSWTLASTVVVAALQRAMGQDHQPVFLLKGGVYIEFQLGDRTRATEDIDTLFRGSLADFEAALDQALAQPWGPFRLERTDIATIQAPKVVKPRRFDIKLIAKGAVWRRVQVEVSFPEGHIADYSIQVPSPQIGFFGIKTPEDLLGIAMDYQVAQKLHACTDPDEPNYENQRVHDVLDLLLVKDPFYPDGSPPSLKAACLDIFQARAEEARALGRPVRHWPPTVTPNDYWTETYPTLAESLDITLPLDEAIAVVNAWITEIEQVG